MSSSDTTAVIMARVSTKGQEDEGFSLESQVKLLSTYCSNNTLTVLKTFKIAESASSRPPRIEQAKYISGFSLVIFVY